MLFVADGVGVGDGHDSTRHDTDELRGNGVNGGDRGGGGGGGEFRTLVAEESVPPNPALVLTAAAEAVLDSFSFFFFQGLRLRRFLISPFTGRDLDLDLARSPPPLELDAGLSLVVLVPLDSS